MTKYKSQSIKNTFSNARKGLILALISETNIRKHFALAFVVMFLGFFFKFDNTKLCVLLLTISGVIGAEMINSAIEYSLDAVFHNKYSKLVGMAKDIAAGAVMFTSVIALLIGILLFLPELLKYIYNIIYIN